MSLCRVGLVVDNVGGYPSTLGNRYSLLGVLGTGGMGVVWRAFDQTLRRHVACKVLFGSETHDPVFQRRFEREAHHIASLSHPNIVMVYDSGTDGDFSFIVMEYVEGASLRRVLGAGHTMPVGATAALAVQVLNGLGHAHDRGIVHRDVKPSNLLFTSAGAVKVADFGIAKSMVDVTELTAAGAFVGTSTYASPEQLAGRPIGPASDIYSLGCVLFQCLSGQPPFIADAGGRHVVQHQYADPPSLSAMSLGIPDEISGAVARSLAKDPNDRFSSAADMGSVFARFADDTQLAEWLAAKVPTVDEKDSETTEPDATPIGHAPPHDRAAKTSVDRKRYAAFGAIVVLIGAGLLTWFIVSRQSPGLVKTSSVLHSGQFLQPNRSITSANGRFELVMQSDGNLVDYRRQGKRVLWESGTSGNFGAYVVMQSDGDLVVYPHGKTAPAPGQPTSALWSSGTYGHVGASANLLNNGDLIVRSAGNHATVWQAIAG